MSLVNKKTHSFIPQRIFRTFEKKKKISKRRKRRKSMSVSVTQEQRSESQLKFLKSHFNGLKIQKNRLINLPKKNTKLLTKFNSIPDRIIQQELETQKLKLELKFVLNSIQETKKEKEQEKTNKKKNKNEDQEQNSNNEILQKKLQKIEHLQKTLCRLKKAEAKKKIQQVLEKKQCKLKILTQETNDSLLELNDYKKTMGKEIEKTNFYLLKMRNTKEGKEKVMIQEKILKKLFHEYGLLDRKTKKLQFDIKNQKVIKKDFHAVVSKLKHLKMKIKLQTTESQILETQILEYRDFIMVTERNDISDLEISNLLINESSDSDSSSVGNYEKHYLKNKTNSQSNDLNQKMYLMKKKPSHSMSNLENEGKPNNLYLENNNKALLKKHFSINSDPLEYNPLSRLRKTIKKGELNKKTFKHKSNSFNSIFTFSSQDFYLKNNNTNNEKDESKNESGNGNGNVNEIVNENGHENGNGNRKENGNGNENENINISDQKKKNKLTQKNNLSINPNFDNNNNIGHNNGVSKKYSNNDNSLSQINHKKITSHNLKQKKNINQIEITSLEMLLRFSTGVSYFTEFLSQQLNLENILFFQAVKQFKRNCKTQKKIKKTANKISKKYIYPNSFFEINIQSVTRKGIIKNIEEKNYFLKMFDQAQVTVYDHMNLYCWEKFQQSQLYKDLIKNLNESSTIINFKQKKCTLIKKKSNKLHNKSPALNDEFSFQIGSRHPLQVVEEITMYLMDLLHTYYCVSIQKINIKLISQSIQFRRFVELTSELQKIKLEKLITDQDKICFFLNLYNTLTFHSFIINGIPKEKVSVERFLKNSKYNIQGLQFSLNDIYHGILRSNKDSKHTNSYFKNDDPRNQYKINQLDPRIHFAIVNFSFPTYIKIITLGNLNEILDRIVIETLTPKEISYSLIIFITSFLKNIKEKEEEKELEKEEEKEKEKRKKKKNKKKEKKKKRKRKRKRKRKKNIQQIF
ncbi:electron carrier/ protein disulfide oxidoreductase [Anaeramoeba flamelloides]|uniref:Electron carrier/ protein disulfide oxidoreductase n=1 Tax=Anaeramoeba flamelloides TaxID=1746091 RepID=A0AAV7Z4D9_9EUKA|nr:electron carrier/ protein disulfide oxidoreductase [Anaeramoeba flamelloides]